MPIKRRKLLFTKEEIGIPHPISGSMDRLQLVSLAFKAGPGMLKTSDVEVMLAHALIYPNYNSSK